jgi:hypothetical protein
VIVRQPAEQLVRRELRRHLLEGQVVVAHLRHPALVGVDALDGQLVA